MTKPIAEGGSGPATLDRLAEVLDRYGASQPHWPTQYRDALEALILRSARAQALVRAAEELEEALDAVQPPEPSDALIGNVLGTHAPRGAAKHRPARRTVNWVFQLGPAPAAPASALAAAVVTIVAMSHLQSDTALPSRLVLEPEAALAEIGLVGEVEQSVWDVESDAGDVEEDQIGLTEVFMVALDVDSSDELSQLSLE